MAKTLDERVQGLERTNRVLLGIVGILAVLAGMAFRTYQAIENPATLRAQKFELVDADGRLLAELKKGEKGPGLFILDPQGRERLVMTREADQSGFFVLDEEGQVRVGAVQFSHGGGGFALHGPAAKGTAVLYLKGQGSLSFYDEEGTLTAKVPNP